MMAENKHVQEPRSILAGKTRGGIDLLQSKWFNLFYDGLTIFISIADVTTDIMVLLSYYEADRSEFFYISLTILILAQFGYVMVFLFTFSLEHFFSGIVNLLPCLFCDCKCCNDFDIYQYNVCIQIIGFSFSFLIFGILALIALIIAMIFGHLVAFLMYFAEDEESKAFQFLNNRFSIKKRTRIGGKKWRKGKLSQQTKFAMDKMNKHGGFILEAFMEALPQSILQLVAMVYYKETNIISIGSILLSMTSIITKSFVISRGIEWKSYLFCWLCVVTDFFSIFFIVSWIFLSNDYINGDFLGYFSIIGELWCIKVGISIIPPLVAIVVLWILVGFWVFFHRRYDGQSDCPCWLLFIYLLLCVIFLNGAFVIGFSIFAVVVGLFAEIFCFSIIAWFVAVHLTSDRWKYESEVESNALKQMLDFVENAAPHIENDRVVRMLCLNYAYYSSFDKAKHHAAGSVLDFIESRHEADTLNTVSYKDVRKNCYHTEHACEMEPGAIVQYFVGYYKDLRESMTDSWNTKFVNSGNVNKLDYFVNKMEDIWYDIAILLFVFISMPIYGASRIFTIAYPYVLLFYILYYDLVSKLELFELSMLGIYIGLQLSIFVLGVFVFRIHLWLWHILPGEDKWQMRWDKINVKEFLSVTYKYYDEVQWLPFAKEIVIQRFGKDIGGIIVDYLKAMHHINKRRRIN